MSKVPDENSENRQSLSSSNTRVINENDENGHFSSSSVTQVANEYENGQSLSTSDTKVGRKRSKPTRKGKLKVLLGVLLMLFSEFVLPLIIYYVLRDHIGDIKALIISGIPPFLVVIYGLIRNRRIDILGVIIIISFIVGVITAALKNNPRIYLLRESVITGSVGITFLLTLIPIKIGSFKMRPIIFYLSRDMTTGGAFGSSSKKTDDESITSDIIERWEGYWNNYALFRHRFYFLTVLWGVGLIAEVPMRVIIVFKAPTVERAVFWSNVISYSWLALLTITSLTCSAIFKKRCQKEIPEYGEPSSNQTSV